MQKLHASSLKEVPLEKLIGKLEHPRDMLKNLTPAGREIPDGWRVLSTVELLNFAAAPWVHMQAERAHAGNAPVDTMVRQLVPLFEVRLH
jgi:hypothetical protein